MTVEAAARHPATAQDSRPNSLGGRQDGELLRRYAATRDPQLREQLVCRFLPLARYAATRYARGAEPFDDLVQVACVGLLKALDRFDPGRGAAFSSYALPTMSGELRRHFRDRGWAVRPPRDLQEQALRIERAGEELARELGRSPTVAELAARAGLDEEAVLEAREALCARTSASLSAPSRSEEPDEHTLESRLGTEEPGYRLAEDRATVASLSRVLTPREREVLRLRFDADLTQAEIGRIVGLSQMHVSRVLRASLDKLRLAGATPSA